jgi:predicted transcriptional regulator
MAIHPSFAFAILEGTKRVEFRKRRLAADIEQVLVYATSPIQRIVGRFFVAQTTSGSPSTIWDEFGHVGAIDRGSYDRYYSDLLTAVAIGIRGAEKFTSPLRLADLPLPASPPQSFVYVPLQEELESLLRHATPAPEAQPSAQKCSKPELSHSSRQHRPATTSACLCETADPATYTVPTFCPHSSRDQDHLADSP